MKLHQLRNGVWVDPRTITLVKPMDQSLINETIGPRVLIRGDDGGESMVALEYFDTFTEARAYADTLAALVNEAAQ